MLDIAKDVLIDAPLLQVIVAQLPKHYDVRVMNWGSSGIKLYSSRRAVVLSIPSLVGKTYAEVRKILSATIKSGGFILRSAKPAPTSRYVAPANEMYSSRSLHGDDDSYNGNYLPEEGVDVDTDFDEETPFDTPDTGVDLGIEAPVMEHGQEEEVGPFSNLPPMRDVDMGIGLTADVAYH